MSTLASATALAWCTVLALLAPPAWRLVRGHARYLDALWTVLLLGVGNRLVTDYSGAKPPFTQLSAILLAIVLCLVIRSYQHADD